MALVIIYINMKGNKDINIKFIDGLEQRYSTCGDYWETDNSIEIRITKQDNPECNLLIMLHEMIEYILCEKRGIKEADITNFDLEWEKLSEPKEDEPGNSKWAPYYKEHRIAENFERQLASLLDIDWFQYENNLKI